MQKPKLRKVARFTNKAAQPYALGIGQTVLTWNDLQEVLGQLFARLMRSDWHIFKQGDDIMVTCTALAAWQSLKMDRAKRDLISSVLDVIPPDEIKKWPKTVADITWLLKETNKLEDIRNDAIHAPLRFFHEERNGQNPPSMEAASLFGNVRAKKISKKDILAEFRYCRDAAVTLRNFADGITHGLHSDELPWPDRPKMPVRKATKSKILQRRPTRGLIDRPPPRSSQA